MHENLAGIAGISVRVSSKVEENAQLVNDVSIEGSDPQDAYDGHQIKLIAVVLDGDIPIRLRGSWELVSGTGKGIHLQLLKQLWLTVVYQVINYQADDDATLQQKVDQHCVCWLIR